MKIDCYLNYSSFGNYVSEFPDAEIFDPIVVDLPPFVIQYETQDGFKAYDMPDGTKRFLNDLFIYQGGKIYITWLNGYYSCDWEGRP